MTKPTGRPRGRPKKPKPDAIPRHAPLPFQDARDILASQLRAELKPATTETPASGLTTLVAAAGTPAGPLATVILGPFQQALRIELTPEQQAKALSYLRDRQKHPEVKGLAPNSRAGMASDWLNWLGYCLHNDCPVLPTSFDDLKLFLNQLVAAGRQKATVEHHVWSICRINRRFGCPDPMASEIATDYWRDLLREKLSGEQKQAEGFSLRVIHRMAVALSDPDHVVATRRVSGEDRIAAEEAQRRRRLRDVAMVNAAYDLLTRASELVSMRWDRITRDASGSGAYRFGKTKTDQVGLGITRYLRPETMAALDAWKLTAGPNPFPFHKVLEYERDHEPSPVPEDVTDVAERERIQWPPLTTQEVGVIFRRGAKLAGVKAPQFSGHSTRVGATQDLIEAGGTLEEAIQAGRWKDGRMAMRYAAKPLAKRAGQNRFRKVETLLNADDKG
ncbi:MAG: hypothetical protein EPN74_01930 [Rhodanobacter sp.]|nr:MAG: hypothetical protein EPN74_01930 [Rhodanobacter sp.]